MLRYRKILLLPLILFVTFTAGCSDKAKHLKIGDAAPLFSSTDIHGNPVSLAAMKSKTVVLRFFLPDCRYCKADTAAFNKIYHRYHDKGLEILYIAVSPDTDQVKAFDRDLKLPFPLIQDSNGKIAAKYLIKAVPQVLILSPDFKIKAVVMGGVSEEELDQLIAKYIH